MVFGLAREMHTYKGDVRNTAHPEGCIAQSYIQNECLTFCSRYLTMTETKFNHLDRNEVEEVNFPYQLSIFGKPQKPIGKASFKQLSFEDWKLARFYVLKNCSEAEPFFQYVCLVDNKLK